MSKEYGPTSQGESPKGAEITSVTPKPGTEAYKDLGGKTLSKDSFQHATTAVSNQIDLTSDRIVIPIQRGGETVKVGYFLSDFDIIRSEDTIDVEAEQIVIKEGREVVTAVQARPGTQAYHFYGESVFMKDQFEYGKKRGGDPNLVDPTYDIINVYDFPGTENGFILPAAQFILTVDKEEEVGTQNEDQG